MLEQTVAAPLENAINGVEDMLYMSSNSSSNGGVEIQVTFNIGADVDQAALNVNNRVKQAEARLPQEVRRQGVTVEKGSSAFLQVLAFYSPDGRFDDLFTSNYVTLNVLDQLKRLPGTTNVQIFGAKDYAMRIWLRPDRLAQLKLTTGDVVRAINEQNAQFAAGKVGQAPTDERHAGARVHDHDARPACRSEGVRKHHRSQQPGRLDDSRARRCARRTRFARLRLYRPLQRPERNAGRYLFAARRQCARGREERQERPSIGCSRAFPAGLTYAIPYDTTRFVEVSIHEVVLTLAIAIVLVFLVVYLFLQSWRATLIPIIAVPVSLIGTFAGLLMLGYSINTLTLFGMVLAIGIVVDDAIVVLENVERIMREENLNAREAAIIAMEEVTSPIIAIVLVLVSVFVPIAFLGGLTGELYRQFAITISIAVTISGIVALTLTPALCSLLLKQGAQRAPRFFRAFNGWFGRVTSRYTAGVVWMIRRSALGLGCSRVMVVVRRPALWRITPGSLVPDEDQGFYIAAVILPDGASSAADRQSRVAKSFDASRPTRTIRTWSHSPASIFSAAACAITPRRFS